eukprot:scaffold29974_cov79-Isochrysis_galbana.AAC.2
MPPAAPPRRAQPEGQSGMHWTRGVRGARRRDCARAESRRGQDRQDPWTGGGRCGTERRAPDCAGNRR